MATLHVRNVPDDLYGLLRERAAGNDRSIGAEAVQLLYELLVATPRSPRPIPFPGLRRRQSGPIGAFSRFTAEARHAVVTAQAEARALKHRHVGSEHLLLGVLALDVPVASALAGIGLTPEEVRGRLDPGDEQPQGQLPFEPEAKRALEIALRESSKLGHTVIAPMHIALGIAGASASRGATILQTAEPDELKLRTTILGSIGAPPFSPTGFPPRAPIDTSFRVVLLEGEAADWEAKLNDAASLGYDLIEIVDHRAIFRR